MSVPARLDGKRGRESWRGSTRVTLPISGARRTWFRRDSSFSPNPTTRSGHIQPGRRAGDEVNPLSKDGPVCSMRERRAGKET